MIQQPRPVMLTLNFLVDYYSQAEVRNRELSFQDHELAVWDLITNAVTAARQLLADTDEIRLRLYGGWFDESGMETQDRLNVGAVLRKLTPTRLSKKTRILAECADSLWVPGSQVQAPLLPSTLRASAGLTWFRVQKPVACAAGPSGCALDDLESWKRGRCPRRGTCTVEADTVITSIRQKLVDSMLVCDQIEMSRSNMGWVVTASNDDDVIPALMVSARHSNRVGLVRIGKRKPSKYDDTLRALNVHIIDVEA